MKHHLQCAEQQASPIHLTKCCACHAKWMSCLIVLTYETSFTMRGATGITLTPHQTLRLPRKMNVMIDRAHIWNVISNAQSSKSHPPTSPNTAPTTQNACHDWSCSRMKRHLQCAKQQVSPCDLTKYCACHAKLHSQILGKFSENSWSAISNARPIGAWSETDPTTIRPRKRKPQPAAPQRLLFALARSRFYWKLQRFPLRLSFQISPHAAPATKSDTWTSPNTAPTTQNALILNVIYNARSNRHHPHTSPNTAPATQNECHDWSCSHMKRHFQCAEQQESPSNFTKYCAYHAKCMSWLILLTYETSFTMRKATGITLQPHQILRLPRKIALPNLREI